MDNRDDALDIVKFVAIMMVILWHLLSKDLYYSGSSVAVNLIIGCNMPIFFCLSGYFSRKMHRSHNLQNLIARIVSYIWPIGIFSLVDLLLAATLKNDVALLKFWVRDLFFCFWFFCCLSLCEIVTFVVYLAGGGDTKRLALLFTGAFLFAWAIPFGLYSFVSMVPFYWFGCFLFQTMYDKMRYGGWILLCGLALIIYVTVSMLEGDIRVNGMGFYWFKMPLIRFTWRGFAIMLSRYSMGILGIMGMVSIMYWVVRHVCILKFISRLGRTTFGVYFLHRYFVDPDFGLGQFANNIHGLFGKIICTVVIFIICHCLFLWTKKVNLFNLALWGPIKYIKIRGRV